MFQNKKQSALIGLAVMLFLIATIFYTMAEAQPANVDDAVKMTHDWKVKNEKRAQWVHFVTAVSSETSNGVILPNGQPMPSSYTNDEWYYVNEAGLVEKGVFSMKDNDGNVFQQVAYQNNILINFTFGDRQENQQPYPLNFDFGFEGEVRDAEHNKTPIKKSDDNVDGKPSVAYSYTEKLKLPTRLGADDVIVNSITKKGSFDKATGDFERIQIIWTLANGTKVVFDSTKIINIEGFADAPDEILNILETVK